MTSPCTLDYTDPQQIVDRFRDLIDIGPMLEMDAAGEIIELQRRLRAKGWSDDHICRFQASAVATSMWQGRVPSCSSRTGDMRAYEDWKFRSR